MKRKKWEKRKKDKRNKNKNKEKEEDEKRKNIDNRKNIRGADRRRDISSKLMDE